MSRSATTFRRNLRGLCERAQVNFKQVAHECGFDSGGYKWLRTVATRGITRVQENNWTRLAKVIEFFAQRLPAYRQLGPQQRIDRFWDPMLLHAIDASRPLEARHLRTCEMLAALLDTGRCEFLVELISRLHSDATTAREAEE